MRRTLLAFAASLFLTSPAFAGPAYTLTMSTALGAPDRFDYAVFDAAQKRVYVAHGDKLAVLDAGSGALVGNVEGMAGGSHGIAISTRTGRGFTDDGRDGLAIVFDLKSLLATKRIVVEKDADALVADAVSGHIFVIEGDPHSISVIDPKTDVVVATIKVGEGLEYAASDNRGSLYVAGVEKSDVIRIDTRKNTVTAHWPTPDCVRPHGLAFDPANSRVFMGCVNSVMVVLDAKTGRVVAKLPIGRGNDAVAWDPVRERVFSSNGIDGTITIYHQSSPDDYELVEILPTAVSGRTMTVDPSTGRLFVPAFDTEPNPTPGGRPKPKPGSLRVMIFDPAA